MVVAMLISTPPDVRFSTVRRDGQFRPDALYAAVEVPEPFQAKDSPVFFDHHERGHNCCQQFNRAPTMDY